MRFAETYGSVDTVSHEDWVSVGDLRQISSAELRRLGMSQLVYLRSGMVDGQTVYAIHAADGTAMAVVEDLELAVDLVSTHDLAFVAVH
jgi:hypothetical protein